MTLETPEEHERRLDYAEHDRTFALFGRVVLIGGTVMAFIAIIAIGWAH